MWVSAGTDRAIRTFMERATDAIGKLDKAGISKLIESMGKPDGAKIVKANTAALMSAIRKDLFKTVVGVSPKRLLLIGGASVIGIYATIKVIKAVLNYETQRLAIKNGVSEALAQAAPNVPLPPPGYGPSQQP